MLKTRGSAHDQHLRQWKINSEGISLGEQFEAGQNLV
jgi:hypothetical protein